MFDYEGWVRRAAMFVSGLETLRKPIGDIRATVDIGPPLTAAEARKLQGEIDVRIPDELCRFWQEAARYCACRYRINRAASTGESGILGEQRLYGGPVFFEATELPARIVDCREWAEEAEPESYWHRAVPFAALENGDYLGVLSDAAGGAVVYLSHDDDCQVLAPSFSEFLQTWERLCYIGPEIWMFDEFLGADGLQADSDQAQAFRDLFDESKPLLVKVENASLGELEQQRLSSMKQISVSAVMYISDEDGQLPNANNWPVELRIYDSDIEKRRHFGGTPETVCLMNAALSEVHEDSIGDPDSTVLFFEGSSEEDSVCGTQAEVTPREPAMFVFASSRACLLDAAGQRELKWSAS